VGSGAGGGVGAGESPVDPDEELSVVSEVVLPDVVVPEFCPDDSPEVEPPPLLPVEPDDDEPPPPDDEDESDSFASAAGGSGGVSGGGGSGNTETTSSDCPLANGLPTSPDGFGSSTGITPLAMRAWSPAIG
jgi:hypothetical protein